MPRILAPLHAKKSERSNKGFKKQMQIFRCMYSCWHEKGFSSPLYKRPFSSSTGFDCSRDNPSSSSRRQKRMHKTRRTLAGHRNGESAPFFWNFLEIPTLLSRRLIKKNFTVKQILPFFVSKQLGLHILFSFP